MESDRRQFLKTVGGVTLGMVAFSGMAGLASCDAKEVTEGAAAKVVPPVTPSTTPPAAAQAVALPWPYKKLDPVAAAERAYAAYSNGGCMYGAFEGIVGELKAVAGEPFTTMPTAFAKYGGAGVSGWGTLCGALNGAAAAIYIVHEAKTGGPIINELYGWYGQEALPTYRPKTPKFETKSSVAESPLCHQSVTRWCDTTGFKALSPERAERCAWLTASVVQYTVELLNKQADAGSITILHAVPAEAKSCLACHGKGGPIENVHMSNVISCTSCHDPLPASHPK